MDEDGDGTITEYEFIKFMLTKSEIIDEKVLDNLHNQFTKLDVDGSGEITRQDIELRDSKVLETPTRRNDNSEQPGAASPQSEVSSLSPSSRSSGRSQESGSPARSRNTFSRRSPSPTMTDGTREGVVDPMVAAYRKFPAQTVRTPSSPPSSPWDDTATNPANGDLSFAQASITRLRRVAEGLDTPEEKEEKVGREEEGLVDNQRKETKGDDGGTIELEDIESEERDEKGLLLPLSIVRECVITGAPLEGEDGAKLLRPEEVKAKFGAFVPTEVGQAKVVEAGARAVAKAVAEAEVHHHHHHHHGGASNMGLDEMAEAAQAAEANRAAEADAGGGRGEVVGEGAQEEENGGMLNGEGGRCGSPAGDFREPTPTPPAVATVSISLPPSPPLPSPSLDATDHGATGSGGT